MATSVKIVKGNLLDATEDYIAHQCNCVTNHSKHIATQIFDKWPHANTYKLRTANKVTHNIPGTIQLLGNGIDQRYIINMYAQYYPSTARYANDSKALRLKWFQECLDLIAENGIKNIAMPCRIGCGSAGGDWNTYLKLITEFADKYNIKVTLYDFDPNK
ncbi:macro domain-containing protein [Fadolivirus algeromassiliense]|jgi:O-acetyl-ADP-ribose deacetylase (regulator of RNase III)|uniref:Macro domain-containing protein n=1 Tax=Fadolivirus FV1/VV64 TaxID=3070911 RepID=A0A7D3UU98_9VIRU|nr:macro domain-containing protein [Fadolivirus algeromassiliense]QKF94011.1 macro domain-containing protein [Fadolivirus FV1/VV64]